MDVVAYMSRASVGENTADPGCWVAAVLLSCEGATLGEKGRLWLPGTGGHFLACATTAVGHWR